MRTRDRDQDWIEELGRRRLEALIAELTPPGAAGVGEAPADEDGPVARAGQPDRDPVVPGAGRHVRRPLTLRGRIGGWVSDRLPVGLQQGHVGVLALVLAVAVLLGGWGWAQAGGTTQGTAAPRVATPASPSGLLTSSSGPSAPAGSLGAPGSSMSAASAPAEVVVHVAGKVRRPGIVVLPAGSRVVDAVRRAGGFVPGAGARSAALNLARVLVVGEQVVVGAAGSAGTAAATPGAAGTTGATGTGPLVSLNTADQASLESLPGVGPVTATAILQWRSEHGPFTAIEQLLEVSGIGEATLAEIQPHVTL